MLYVKFVADELEVVLMRQTVGAVRSALPTAADVGATVAMPG